MGRKLTMQRISKLCTITLRVSWMESCCALRYFRGLINSSFQRNMELEWFSGLCPSISWDKKVRMFSFKIKFYFITPVWTPMWISPRDRQYGSINQWIFQENQKKNHPTQSQNSETYHPIRNDTNHFYLGTKTQPLSYSYTARRIICKNNKTWAATSKAVT